MSCKNWLVAVYLGYTDKSIADLPLGSILPEEWFKIMNQELQMIKYSEAVADPESAKRVEGMITFGYRDVDFSLFPNLRIISNYGAGIDGINVNALKKKGIMVTNTPNSVASATADLAVGLLIAVARRFRQGLIKALESSQMGVYTSCIDLHSKTVGIVGLGGIGFQIVKRLNGFDMEIFYHQRNRRADDNILNAKYFPALDDMLPHCDFVVIAVPLTSETNGMFNDERLKKMKPKSVLINIARGPIVDLNALCKSLEDNHLAGAGLDVTDPEPLPSGHPLLQRDDVFLLPHIGTATPETRLKMLNEMLLNLTTALHGQTPPNIV